MWHGLVGGDAAHSRLVRAHLSELRLTWLRLGLGLGLGLGLELELGLRLGLVLGSGLGSGLGLGLSSPPTPARCAS